MKLTIFRIEISELTDDRSGEARAGSMGMSHRMPDIAIRLPLMVRLVGKELEIVRS